MANQKATSEETAKKAEGEHRTRWNHGRWEKLVLGKWRPITPPDVTAATPGPAVRPDESAGENKQTGKEVAPEQEGNPKRVIPVAERPAPRPPA